MKTLEHPTVHESLFYQTLPHGNVECTLCERRCLIAPGDMGVCETRMNGAGKLYTLVYGALSAVESRPIEIKPFFHYWPGSTALTFSTWSCNLNCVWCQNHHLSKTPPQPARSRYHPPERIVEEALKQGDQGLCGSFQEPTLLTDWVVPLFERGRQRGLYCCFVSNGYMTLDALRSLTEAGLDGIKIDVKGDAQVYQDHCGGADVEKVWRNVREARTLGLHVEIVNLVVTGVNDDEACLREVIETHLKEAGAETPLHFTRYSPAYRFHNPATKLEILVKAYDLAKEAGVLYPYLGNVPGHQYENTYCPDCEELLIRRWGYTIRSYHVTLDNHCPQCGRAILVVGRHI